MMRFLALSLFLIAAALLALEHLPLADGLRLPAPDVADGVAAAQAGMRRLAPLVTGSLPHAVRDFAGAVDALAAMLAAAGMLALGATFVGGRIFRRLTVNGGARPAVPQSDATAGGAALHSSIANAQNLDASDRAFLPAALEILETPPSPVRVAGIWLICLAFVSALLLSWFGKLDIHAIAQGRIQPNGRSKVIQPLEPGKVVALMVDNGSRVAAGDVLLELDPTETGADLETQVRELESSRAEAERRRTAIAVARSGKVKPVPISFNGVVSDAVRSREESVLVSELTQLAASIASLEAQLEERGATRDRLKASIGAREKLLALTQERVDMRTTVHNEGSLSRAIVIESLQQHESQMITQATEKGQLAETLAAINTTERKLDETVTQFVNDQNQKLVDAERKADRIGQDLVKAKSKNERTVMRAPIAGTVQQLAVTTVGQVVTTGQALLTLVPSDAPIEIEAFVQNQDIGFIEPGQRAVIKVESFPFTRYGTIDGRIEKVSRDAVEEKEASTLSDPSGAVRPNGAAPPASRGQTLVFPATVSLDKRSIDVDGKAIPLVAGMAVTVEILTGQRRAIDYVLAPLRETMGKAGHER